MKNSSKVISLILTLALILSVVLTIRIDASAKVKINKNSVTMNSGETITLKVNGTKKKVKWSSSNKKVVIVNNKGKITAKKKGTATITAKVGGKKYRCKVIVKNKDKNGFPYEMYKVYDKGGINVHYYAYRFESNDKDKERNDKLYKECFNKFIDVLYDRYPEALGVRLGMDYIGTYGGKIHYKYYVRSITDLFGKEILKLENKPKSKCPYKSYKVYDKGDMNIYFYYTARNDGMNNNEPKSKAKYDKCHKELEDILNERYGGEHGISGRDYASEYLGTYGGVKYYKAYSSYVKGENGEVIAQYPYKNSRK